MHSDFFFIELASIFQKAILTHPKLKLKPTEIEQGTHVLSFLIIQQDRFPLPQSNAIGDSTVVLGSIATVSFLTVGSASISTAVNSEVTAKRSLNDDQSNTLYNSESDEDDFDKMTQKSFN
jgi:hypothetical protein